MLLSSSKPWLSFWLLVSQYFKSSLSIWHLVFENLSLLVLHPYRVVLPRRSWINVQRACHSYCSFHSRRKQNGHRGYSVGCLIQSPQLDVAWYWREKRRRENVKPRSKRRIWEKTSWWANKMMKGIRKAKQTGMSNIQYYQYLVV